MPVFGDLKTMSLTDLLQWASMNTKTGVLELERNKVCRSIEFRNGLIGACSTDDPPARLGQFLLARGKITKDNLRAALSRQEKTKENLGVILMKMGALTQEELTKHIKAKAEETIQGLFDWEDAIFRFHDGATLDPNQIEVKLSVDDILLRGIQHHDELTVIREAFPSSGIVLERTDRQPPAQMLKRLIARRIWESIDGEKTLAEILLHTHAGEFLVIKFLHTLHRSGLARIKETRPVAAGQSTLLDRPIGERGPEDEGWDAFRFERSFDRDIDPATGGDGDRPDVEERGAPATGSGLDAEVEVARRLMSRGEHEAALELLNASYRAHPDENYLRRLIAKAEAEFVESMQTHRLAPDRVPVALPRDGAPPTRPLGPQEAYLLSLLDGSSDIRSVLWLAPLREVDVLRTLRQLLGLGLIELRDPGSASGTPTEGGEASGDQPPR